MGVLLGIRIGSKCNERSRWASDTRGETVDISVSEEVSEETRGGSGCRRESNGDDRGRDKDEGEEQNDSITNHVAGNRSCALSYSFVQSLSGSPKSHCIYQLVPSVRHHNRNGKGFQPFQRRSDQSCNRSCAHCI